MTQGIEVQYFVPYVHTQVSCSIELIGSPTIMYEDNIACVLLNILQLNFSTHMNLSP
jgi:hypothetical protein